MMQQKRTPFIINTEGEKPNVFCSFIKFDLIPSFGCSPSIGIFFRIISNDELLSIIHNIFNHEDKKLKEEKPENPQPDEQTIEFEKVKLVIEKIICLTKDGISMYGKTFEYNDIMFEKIYDGNVDITPEDKNKIRDSLIKFYPDFQKRIWKKFKEL